MIRQYHAERRQGGNNPRGIGVIAAGRIFYLQGEGWWRDRYRGAPICRSRSRSRSPWIVESFLNGTMGAARRIMRPACGKTSIWPGDRMPSSIHYATAPARQVVLPSAHSSCTRTMTCNATAIPLLDAVRHAGLPGEKGGNPHRNSVKLTRLGGSLAASAVVSHPTACRAAADLAGRADAGGSGSPTLQPAR